jgi:ribonuclease HII
VKTLPRYICGLDEAGRGALAGPVVAAAVILRSRCRIPGLADSKTLTCAQRESLAEAIRSKALAWAVAEASPDEICTLNILRASLLAMRRAYFALDATDKDAEIIVDGNFYPEGMPEGRALKHGDALIPAVSAASILAKVHRDALMAQLQNDYPQFSFAKHKGYGTAQHLRELEEHGPLELHRSEFAPIKILRQPRLEF